MRTVELVKFVGIDTDTLQRWLARFSADPADHPGPGRYRVFGVEEAVALRVMKRLCDMGIRLGPAFILARKGSNDLILNRLVTDLHQESEAAWIAWMGL